MRTNYTREYTKGVGNTLFGQSRIANLGESASAAGRRAMRARWGAPRGECARVRVDLAAAERLSRVPERDRRRVATDGVLAAANTYLREHGQV